MNVPFAERTVHRVRTLALLLSGLLLCAADAETPASGAVVEDLAVESPSGSVVEGRLDWTEGTVTVTGEGFVDDGITHPVRRRLLGFRAAKVDAYRKLLEVVGGVQVDARTTVSMAMVSSDSVRARVEGLVTGARVVPGSQVEESGYYRVDLRVDLRGPLADAVLTDSVATVPLPESVPARDSVVVFVPPVPYTGLVVDARGLSLQASLSPRVVDESGRVIYAAEHVDRDYAVRTGVVGYQGDMERAVAAQRVGGEAGNPFLVEAVGVSGLYNSDVVVTRDMGTRIRMADMRSDFLRDCRVIFVVGDKPAKPAPISAPAVAGGDSADATIDAAWIDSADNAGAVLAVPDMPQGDFLDSILEARALADTLPAGQSP